MKLYSQASQELTRIGRFFDAEKEREAREKLGEGEVRKQMKKWGLGFVSRNHAEELGRVAEISGEANSPELRSQLTHLCVMRAQIYFQVGGFDECISTVEDLFRKNRHEPARSCAEPTYGDGPAFENTGGLGFDFSIT